jgi:hypothetical protein
MQFEQSTNEQTYRLSPCSFAIAIRRLIPSEFFRKSSCCILAVTALADLSAGV